MDETIIVYTKFYSEAVMQTIEENSLNIQIMCFSSYDDVLRHLTITPNVRGLIFLEHNVRQGAFPAYSKLLTIADEIASATKQPFCVSIISHNELPRKFIPRIITNNIDILFYSFSQMSMDVFKYEGLSTVISRTLGTLNNSILLTLDSKDIGVQTTDPKLEFLTCCLNLVTIDLNRINELNPMIEKYPRLQQLVDLRTKTTSDELYEKATGVFKVFCKYAIDNRRLDL